MRSSGARVPCACKPAVEQRIADPRGRRTRPIRCSGSLHRAPRDAGTAGPRAPWGSVRAASPASVRLPGSGSVSNRATWRVRDVAVVPGEQLVAAIARQHDGDVPARQLRDIPGRNGRRIGERLVEVRRRSDRRSRARRAARRTRDGRPRRARAISRAASSSSYAGSSKPIENVFTGRDEASAISATTRLESTPPDRNAPSGTSLTRCERTASRSRASSISSASVSSTAAASSVGGRPERRHGRVPVAPAEQVPGRQLPHAREDGAVGRRVQEGEVVRERLGIDGALHGAGREQRLQLGAVEETARRARRSRAA